MALSPHPSPTDPATRSGTTVPKGTAQAAPPDHRPWYRKARYGVLLLAVVVVAALVTLSVGDSETTSPGREAGNVPTRTVPEHVSNAFDRPYDDAYGWFEPITVVGKGWQTIPLPVEARNGGVVTATYAGSESFGIATRWDSSGTVVSWLAYNDVVYGPYSGTVTYAAALGRAIRHLDVSVGRLSAAIDDAWEVTIAPVSSAQKLPPIASGTGDAVFRYSGPGADVVLQYRGPERFLAFQKVLGQSHAEVLVPGGIGPHSGTRTVHLAPGPSLVVISTDGSWTLTVE